LKYKSFVKVIAFNRKELILNLNNNNYDFF
jgi:hypothetical protein